MSLKKIILTIILLNIAANFLGQDFSINEKILKPDESYTPKQFFASSIKDPIGIILIESKNIESLLQYMREDTNIVSSHIHFEIFKIEYINGRSENPIFDGQKISKNELYLWLPHKVLKPGIKSKSVNNATLSTSQKGSIIKVDIPKDHPCFREENLKYKFQLNQLVEIINQYEKGTYNDYILNAHVATEPSVQVQNTDKIENQLKSILDSLQFIRKKISNLKSASTNTNKNWCYISAESKFFSAGNAVGLKFIIPTKANTFFYSTLSTLQYNYSLFLDQTQYQWNDKNFSLQNLQENGEIQFQQAGLGIGKNWKLSNNKSSKSTGWCMQALVGAQFNYIKHARFNWNNGSANIRGHITGISDEIINVPDLGFQDGLALTGISGNSNFKRFFPSLEGELRIAYHFENISFSGGYGYTYSGKLEGHHPENPIYNGQQANSLTSTLMPMRISTSYFSLSTTLHF
jgi:hypothetical protein